MGNDTNGRPDVGLLFVDLLYAVPVADVATRVGASHMEKIGASGWTDVLLALAAIAFGWIGHHANRLWVANRSETRLKPDKSPFLQLRFPQLVVEMLIVCGYFALGAKIVLPGADGVAHPQLLWKAGWLAGIFALYLLWDALDVAIADNDADWKARAKKGMQVTFLFLLVFCVGVAAILLVGGTHRSSVLVDLVAVALLLAYRLTQALRIGAG